MKYTKEANAKISVAAKKNHHGNYFAKGFRPWNKDMEGFGAGKLNGMYKGKIAKTCIECGKGYEVYPCHKETSKFCSKKCFFQSTSGEMMECATCHKEFYVERKQLEETKYCSRACFGKSISGKSSPHWKGGISRDPYPFEWSKTLKESIRQRDLYKCQKCGVPQEELLQNLCVHHIDENKKNLNPDNLISYCHKCHTLVHGRTRKLQER